MTWPFNRRRAAVARAGVVLDPVVGGAAAVVDQAGGRWRLQHFARCAARADGHWDVDGLAGGCRGEAVAVLGSEHYQLQLVERPDVPPEEVAQAVRWRLRELLDFPVDGAVVDVFDVPTQARGGRRMVYAVAAEGASVAALAANVAGSRLSLGAIDVPELCLRNVATSLEQDRFGVACLRVQGSRGILTLSREQQLYLVRQIEMPAGDTSQGIAQVALEVQRSLDYFESHYDQRPIRDVLVAPAPGAAAFAADLGAEMAVNVGLLELASVVDGAERLDDDDQEHCLLALGAAMRGPDFMERAA